MRYNSQMKKIAIVMPVLNQFELGIKALESVQVSHHAYWQPFIIDNWDVNKGVAAAWNLGTKRAIDAGFNYILIINDDVVLAPNTPEHLSSVIDNDDIGLASATDFRDTMSPIEVKNSSHVYYENDIIDAPDFSCFMITPDTYDHIGDFDEGFSPAYFEDNDYCYRTILSGLKCVRSQSAMFYHYGSKTNEGGNVLSHSEFSANRNRFVSKWGGFPGGETFTKPWNDNALNWRDSRKE